MKGRIYRLNELLQKVDRHLRMESERRHPDAWTLLRLRLLRQRIRNALRRSARRWVNPHRAMRARKALSLLPV